MDSGHPLYLRHPRWLYAAIGVALMFVIVLVCVAGAIDAVAGGASTLALAFPAAVGAGLATGTMAGKMWRQTFLTRREAIVRGAIGFGAVGFTWPASFLVLSLVQHQGVAPTIVGMMMPILFGTVIGAAVGALAAAAASFVALTPEATRPSPAPPPG